MDWESRLNHWHYYGYEKRLQPLGRRLVRRWHAGIAAVCWPVEACRAYRHRRQENIMEDTSTAPVPAAAVGRAILARFDPEMVQALTAAIGAEIREQITAEAISAARRQLEGEFDARREHLLDQLARDRTQLERDYDARLDEEIAARLAAEVQEFEDRVAELRGQRRQWRQRAELAEGLLADLVRQLVGGVDQRPVYLFSTGVRSLSKPALNTALAPAGLRLRSRASASERVVRVELEGGRQAAHSLFWLTGLPVAGVHYTDDGNQDDDVSGPHPEDEAQAVPLALPERANG